MTSDETRERLERLERLMVAVLDTCDKLGGFNTMLFAYEDGDQFIKDVEWLRKNTAM